MPASVLEAVKHAFDNAAPLKAAGFVELYTGRPTKQAEFPYAKLVPLGSPRGETTTDRKFKSEMFQVSVFDRTPEACLNHEKLLDGVFGDSAALMLDGTGATQMQMRKTNRNLVEDSDRVWHAVLDYMVEVSEARG